MNIDYPSVSVYMRFLGQMQCNIYVKYYKYLTHFLFQWVIITETLNSYLHTSLHTLFPVLHYFKLSFLSSFGYNDFLWDTYQALQTMGPI